MRIRFADPSKGGLAARRSWRADSARDVIPPAAVVPIPRWTEDIDYRTIDNPITGDDIRWIE